MLYGSFLLLAQYDFLFKPNQYVARGVIGMAIKMSCICLRAERGKFPFSTQQESHERLAEVI